MTLGASNAESKRRTGLRTESSMLLYIVVVCGDNVELTHQRSSSLSLYKEWLFHFEWKYGRTLQHWEDASNALGLHPMTLQQIF